MAIPLPDWIQVNPRDFVSAAEGGARIGNESRSLGIEQSRIMTDAAIKQQELQQQMRTASMNAANESAMHERESQLRTTELAINSQMEMTKLGLQKSQLDLDTQQAAQKFQAQQQYQQMVAGGMDPVQAALKVGPGMLGESVGGLGTLTRAQNMDRFMPSEVTMPGGETMVQRAPGDWQQARLPKQWQETTRTVNGQTVSGQEDIDSGEFRSYPTTQTTKPETAYQQQGMLMRWQNEMDRFLKDNRFGDLLQSGDSPAKDASKPTQDAFKAAKKRYDYIQQQIDKYSGGEGGASANAPPSPSDDPLGIYSTNSPAQ